MENSRKQNPYDACYYAMECGSDYRHNRLWLDFFNRISEKICATIQPGSVLDAGCAMGFLVEALLARGVEAYGIDISDYAINQASESVKPFLKTGSILEPFSRRYDLIVSIEVLEHLPADQAELAIKNFCQNSDDILFSSGPTDYKEPTHVNVRQPEYWAEIFAMYGFYRDLDYDASFITPWAVRFPRRSDPPHRIIREYERGYWSVWRECVDLREKVLEMRDQISQQYEEVKSTQRQWEVIRSTPTWRAFEVFTRLRNRLIPPDSVIDRLIKSLKK